MANYSRNIRFISGLAVAILLPLSFYIVAISLGKNKMHMPRYYIAEGVKKHEVKGEMREDTVYHTVADLQGINQFGDHISLNKDLQGKILVVDFFFTTCPSVCPRLTGNMKMLANAYKRTPMMRNDTIAQFISITVNPERDSFQALRAYAQRFGVDMNHWWFITGDKKKLYDYARHELHVSAPEGDGGTDDFIHTEQIVVLDADRHIRGYYNGLDSLEIGHCANDIALLALEKKHD